MVFCSFAGPVVKRYRTIVADPPWDFVWQGGPGGRRRNATTLGYDTMSLEAICECSRSDFAADATLFLWLTRRAMHSGDGLTVALAWGFPILTGEFVWRKPNFGAGAFPRIGHEVCAIYRRGNGSLRPDAPRDVHSVQTWSQIYGTNSGKTHSAKPDGFLDLVEQGYEGPYLELFSRRERMGWDSWGDQSLGTAEVAA